MTTGAKIFSFGLDKSRVNSLPGEERTYHVFYQLISGASYEEREALHLNDTLSYQLFNSSRCYRYVLPHLMTDLDSLLFTKLSVRAVYQVDRTAMTHS